MSNPDLPPVDKSGAPLEDEPPGLLLWDPNAPIPLDEIDGYGNDGYQDATPSRMPQIVMGALVLALIGVGGFMAIQGPAETTTFTPGPELPTLTGAGAQAPAITPIPTDNLVGSVGSTVRVAVRVSGRAGVPMADTTIQFAVAAGDGVLSETAARTTADGVASVSLSLPRQPGATLITAGLPGSDIEEGRISVRATAGTPATIAAVSGDRQQAQVSDLLPTRVFVRVLDTEGNPVANTEVQFNVTSGDGITAPSRTRTDSIGRASALWRLGMAEGTQILTATSSANLAQVRFTATALPRTSVEAPGGPESVETAPVTIRRTAFAVGGSHVCSLEGGVLSCRGGNDRGQTEAGGAGGFVSVTAGSAHTCALNASGVASCWGANQSGQLGDGSRNDKSQPTAIRSELRFSALAAGTDHTCGLAGGGVPLCWGLNLSGQLGDGTRNDQTVPRTVGGGLIFRTLIAGWSHTCGLTSNGNAFCWGLNSQGQLGDGTNLDRLVPTLVRGAVTTLVAGSAHTCGITQGTVLCWGGNNAGQLGDGTSVDRAQPVEVSGLPGAATHLAAGAVHTCALVQGGQAYCWGQNFQGQLGDGTTQNHANAVAVGGGLQFSEIHAGGAQTCARTAGGFEYCWGLNNSGQLGDGTRESRSVPTRVGM